MVFPQPESDLSLNVIIVSADIIEDLTNEKRYVIIEDLMKDFLQRDSRRTHELFFDTLTFLFCLGIINLKNYKVRLAKLGITQKTLF